MLLPASITDKDNRNPSVELIIEMNFSLMGGEARCIHDRGGGGPMEFQILNPKKIHRPKNLTTKKIPCMKIFYPKKYKTNTPIKQTKA